MKGHVATFVLLSSIVSAINVRDIHHEEPATWCMTYLSTYLAPVSFQGDLSRPSANSSGSELVSTGIALDTTLPSSAVDILSSSAAGSAPTSASFEPSGLDISTSKSPAEIDTPVPTDMPSTSLTGGPKDIDRTTDVVTDSPTATQPGPGGVITNAVVNGRFAKSSDSGSGLVGWSGEGSVKQQNSDCYKADGSPDDGFAALGTSSDFTDARKRAFNGLGSIFQMLSNLAPSTTTRYTVQFYYVVITVGRGSCSINAYLGNRQFYTMGLFSSGGVSGSWNRVLTTVVADSRSANFGISMTCSGNGLALLYVDSVFVSNQVTPENIDQFDLDFGDGDETPDNPTEQPTSGPPNTPTRRPIDPAASSSGEDISTPIEMPTSDDWKPTSRNIPQNTTDWLPQPETSTGSMETPVSKPTIIQPPREEETSVDLEPTFSEGSTTDWPEQTSDGFSQTSDASVETTEAPSSTTQESTTIWETTTTSEEPSPTCQYSHGEMCNFDRFNYPKDVLCAWEGIYNGELWTESRTDYPVQGRLEHCIAICQGMSNCKSAGYSMITNRCYFIDSALNKDDFKPEDDGWKTTVWLDKRCYTDCGTCRDSEPKARVTDCAYTHEDTCQRVSTTDGKICNYSAYVAGGYVVGDDMIDQFPESDQSSPEKCAAICRAFAWCKGSGYQEGRCKWMAYTLSLTGDLKLDTDQDPSMFSVWDELGCFECPGCQ